jgi:hypothetical protein
MKKLGMLFLLKRIQKPDGVLRMMKTSILTKRSRVESMIDARSVKMG